MLEIKILITGISMLALGLFAIIRKSGIGFDSKVKGKIAGIILVFIGLIVVVSSIPYFHKSDKDIYQVERASGDAMKAFVFKSSDGDGKQGIRVIASGDARSTCNHLYLPLWSFLIRTEQNNLIVSKEYMVGGSSDLADASWHVDKVHHILFGHGKITVEEKNGTVSGTYDLDMGRDKKIGSAHGAFSGEWCERQ